MCINVKRVSMYVNHGIWSALMKLEVNIQTLFNLISEATPWPLLSSSTVKTLTNRLSVCSLLKRESNFSSSVKTSLQAFTPFIKSINDKQSLSAALNLLVCVTCYFYSAVQRWHYFTLKQAGADTVQIIYQWFTNYCLQQVRHSICKGQRNQPVTATND